MQRLYMTEAGHTRFWTAREVDGLVVIHRGTVGAPGQIRDITLAQGQDAVAVIESEVAAARAEGFRPLEPDPCRQVIVIADTTGYEPDEVASSARILEQLCNSCLGRTGNGFCDGPAYGKGSVSVYCPVVERDLAVATIVTELRRHGCDNWEEWLIVSVPEGAGFRVVYRNPAAERSCRA
jgi:hypothetical protein